MFSILVGKFTVCSQPIWLNVSIYAWFIDTGQLCPVMVSVFQSISGRVISPPSQMIWHLNLVYRSVTALHRSWVYSTLLSVCLYMQSRMIGFFRSLQLSDAATNSEVAVVSTSDASRSCLAMIATPPWLLLGLSFLATSLKFAGNTSLSAIVGLSHVSLARIISGSHYTSIAQKLSLLDRIL